MNKKGDGRLLFDKIDSLGMGQTLGSLSIDADHPVTHPETTINCSRAIFGDSQHEQGHCIEFLTTAN